MALGLSLILFDLFLALLVFGCMLGIGYMVLKSQIINRRWKKFYNNLPQKLQKQYDREITDFSMFDWLRRIKE